MTSTIKALHAGIALLAFAAFADRAAFAVDVWITTGDKTRLLSQLPEVVFEPGIGSGGIAVVVDPTDTYQTIEGYGASMTNSSAWLLHNELNVAQRGRLMGEFFSGEDGIGVNFLRLPMGASDFTADGFYTYNDLPAGQTDPDQLEFSIDPDRATILPSLDEARAFNPELKLIGSPWSAPAWMKTSGSLIGGSLDPQWRDSYAIYLLKYAVSYEAEGHPIDFVTLQNEPLFTPGDYPGMFMGAAEQIDLIKNHVGPVFARRGIETGILAYDHNWDDTQYPIDVLNDPQARQYVDGVAFHGYGGDVSAQTTVHNAHPDKPIYFTEISGGDFAPNFEDNLVWYARNLFIGGARNWGSSVIFWNLALDENNGPHQGGCSTCRGVVTIDSTSGGVTYNEEFYALGHASGHVQPGAVRIGSNTVNGVLETVAFRNPDGSEVLLALNPSTIPRTIRGIRQGEHFLYTLPARSLATFAWDPQSGADFDNGGFELGGYDTTGGSLDAWIVWGNSNQNIDVTTDAAQQGDHALRLSGPGSAGAFAGVSQGITVAAGEELQADANVLLPLVGSIAGTDNSLLMKIEYYSTFDGQFQSPEFLGQKQIVVADGATVRGQWESHSIADTAPAGAEEARLVFVFSQPSGVAGQVYVDGVAFSVVPGLAGDFNGDGVVDAADYTVWRDGFGTEFSIEDFNNWVQNFGATSEGEPPQSVPEPWALTLVVTAVTLATPRRRSVA